MDNAHLIGLSRQIALQRQMDVVANNVANVNTNGFKAQALLFEQYEMPVARDRTFAGADQTLSFTQDWATLHDMAGGPVVQTGNPLDIALSGEGFLTVETPAGERWTRSGSLQINAEGTLVTAEGHPVLADGGPVRFGPEETDITISPDGAIASSAGAKGQLQIVEFDDVQGLTREGASLFAGGTPLSALDTRVTQGAIERSNVSGVAEMARMIRVSRAYQSLASLMQKQDDLRRSAIQRLGDMQA